MRFNVPFGMYRSTAILAGATISSRMAKAINGRNSNAAQNIETPCE